MIYGGPETRFQPTSDLHTLTLNTVQIQIMREALAEWMTKSRERSIDTDIDINAIWLMRIVNRQSMRSGG